MGPVMDEVVETDMVGLHGAQPDAGAVVEPQTPRLGCFPETFSPRAATDARPDCR